MKLQHKRKIIDILYFVICVSMGALYGDMMSKYNLPWWTLLVVPPFVLIIFVAYHNILTSVEIHHETKLIIEEIRNGRNK